MHQWKEGLMTADELHYMSENNYCCSKKLIWWLQHILYNDKYKQLVQVFSDSRTYFFTISILLISLHNVLHSHVQWEDMSKTVGSEEASWYKK